MENSDLDLNFDKKYENSDNVFGSPYKELEDYFKKFKIKGSVLDLGSGQGRNSIFFAKEGFNVTAVDNSRIAMDQIILKIRKENLKIKGVNANVLNLSLKEKFDVILFDRILHLFDKIQQSKILKKYESFLSKTGIMCIIFPSDLSSNYFTGLLDTFSENYKVLDNIPLSKIPKIEGLNEDFDFNMIIVKFNR